MRSSEKKKIENQLNYANSLPVKMNESSSITESEIVETRPSLEEVVAYAKEIGNGTDPYNFFTYYMQMGWKTKSGDPITDWKNTFRYWSANERDSTSSSAASARRKKQIPESPNADAYRSLVYNLDEDGSSDRGVPYPETNG